MIRKNWLATLLLCIFFGYFGVHRFYAGKIKTGILWLFTFGMFGFGWLIDIILIATGRFTDRYGNYITSANVSYDYVPRGSGQPAQCTQPHQNSTIAVVGGILGFLALCAVSLWSQEVTVGNLLFGIPVFLLGFAFLWYFVFPKMFREAHIIKEDETPDAFNPFKSKEDKIIDKPQGRFLGYEETLDGMYAENYGAMQFYLNLKMYLEENSHATDFNLGKVQCHRYTGKDNPVWQEAFYMNDMNGILVLLMYNDGRTIYTFKHNKWYVYNLPEDKCEPNLTPIY